MMRIQVRDSKEACILKVEGEIAGIDADELESLWRNLTGSTSAEVMVDLSGVIRIDRHGRRSLKRMHESGVRFTSARMAIQDILDEIAAS